MLSVDAVVQTVESVKWQNRALADLPGNSAVTSSGVPWAVCSPMKSGTICSPRASTLRTG